MSDKDVVFRPAEITDMDQIWELLHAESRTMCTEEIIQKLGNILVLSCHRKIVGILYYKAGLAGHEILWTAVHPMYSEYTVDNIMREVLLKLMDRKHK